jgi:hypothetical protein
VTTAWELEWALGLALSKPRRVVLVTDITDQTLEKLGYVPPNVVGQKPTRLGPGVFGYKTGATLLVWPHTRHARNLPNVGKPWQVLLDPAILAPEHASLVATIGFQARWTLGGGDFEEGGMFVTAMAGIAHTDLAVASQHKVTAATMSSPGSSHLILPFLCGCAVGSLLASKLGNWLAKPEPATVVLHDALGRRAQIDQVMPTLELHAMGKNFRLCAGVAHEIRYVEVHGG